VQTLREPLKPDPVAGTEEVQGATRASVVFERLREDILEGRFAPGEKLRIESLEARYQVGAVASRSSRSAGASGRAM